jgi:hypothetical protein
MTTIDTKTIDQGRLEAFVGQAVVDMGAAISGAAAAYRRPARPVQGDGRRGSDHLVRAGGAHRDRGAIRP